MGLLGSVGILIYRTALPLTGFSLCLNPALSKATEIQPQATRLTREELGADLRHSPSRALCSRYWLQGGTVHLKMFITHLLRGIKRLLGHLLDIKTVVSSVFTHIYVYTYICIYKKYVLHGKYTLSYTIKISANISYLSGEKETHFLCLRGPHSLALLST